MPNGFQTCLERATQLLALRSLSEFEIRAKLGEQYPSDEIESAINKLLAIGALNDQKLAQDITEKLAGKSSSIQIQIALKKRGLDQYWVENESELEAALHIAKKKLSEKSTPATISRYLASKGFAEEVIESALPKLFEDL